MPFSRASMRTASTISCDIALVPQEVRTVDVGVGDGDHARVCRDGDLVLGRAQQLAGEVAPAVVVAARADARAPADVAAEVLGLGQRPLDAGRGDLERVVLADAGQVARHTFAEVE